METVEDRTFQDVHEAQVFLVCPECDESVPFPFFMSLRLTESDHGLPIEVVSVGPISDQPLFDHKLEKHGPDT